VSIKIDPQIDEFNQLPKVDLHRHLEGSLRLQTMLEIVRKYGLTFPVANNQAVLSRLVQIQPEDQLTSENFLAKFKMLRLFFRSPEVIRRITHEAIEDAARDHVRYLELRFTPVALSRAERFPLHEVMDWVCESASESARDQHINVRLISSVNRHESIELAEQVLRLSIERRSKGIVGMDLAGNEAQHPARPFVELFKQARQAGLKVTVHAGEWGGPENVREAMEFFSADRIGHGVNVLGDQYTVDLARERAIPFEVCLTSNYQTGAVQTLAAHPATRMLAAGLNITFNTDDPSISGITLAGEYRLAVDELKIPLTALKQRILAAAQSAFLPDLEKKILVETLKTELAS
jgi:adenosine deaminase